MSDEMGWSLDPDEDVAIIRHDDSKGNAYTTPGLVRLNELLDDAVGSAGAVVLMGRPGFFSSGFDLATIKSGGSGLDELLMTGARTVARILTYPRPVVAACTGHALAAGSLVLLASDVRIGAAGPFRLGLHEVAIGSPLPHFLLEIARYRLPVAGLEAVLRGEILTPEAARSHGYLDAVVPANDVEPIATDEARRLMRLRRGVFAGAKLALRQDVAERMLANLDRDIALLNPRNDKADRVRRGVSQQVDSAHHA